MVKYACTYADDICVLYPYTDEKALKVHMERDAALIFEFSRLNRLVINSSKTKLVRFRPYLRNGQDNFSIFINDNEVFETQSVTYLGVILQCNLSWNLHIDTLKSKISSAIGILYKFKNKFNVETKLMLYQALVQSRLNYLICVYGCRNTLLLKSLQRVQNKALKTVFNLPIQYSTIHLFKDIAKDILPIRGLYKLQILVFVFKSLKNIGHNTISFQINQNRFNTRNNSNLRILRCRLEATKQKNNVCWWF